ncbi:helix-turn-helix domain-containing protein [Paenibacillus sp. BAC0078]
MKKVKSNLKKLADDNGKSIRQVAKDIDYRFETVRQMYNDESKHFPRDLLDKLCTYFSCDINQLLICDEDEETPPV